MALCSWFSLQLLFSLQLAGRGYVAGVHLDGMSSDLLLSLAALVLWDFIVSLHSSYYPAPSEGCVFRSLGVNQNEEVGNSLYIVHPKCVEKRNSLKHSS